MKERMDSQGPRWEKPRVPPLNVKEMNVPREKERLILKVPEGLRKVSFGN